jgi:molybdopterin-containing oxidoreductase family membrane subunit
MAAAPPTRANPAGPDGAPGYAAATATISRIVLRDHAGRAWWIGMGIASLLTLLFLYAVAWLFATGVGIWGVNIPVAWGWAITNFVWWIGIGHAGTFISAVLLLLHQGWRTAINRFAEAMTIFAAGIAGIFPILHLGRPWFFYWLLPYPDVMGVWPQWRSPLVWDFAAISTYLSVSLLFWYMGALPDFATLRDRARRRGRRVIYGLLALGWRGDARHWSRYRTAYLLLAGLATPLVVSVHSVVSLDFAVGNSPGWHSTVFPPYFVAGALLSGFAMVLTLAIPLRRCLGLQEFITPRHLDNAARVMLATGLLVCYGYAAEIFMAFYGGDAFEVHVTLDRFTGPYAPVYWAVIACNAGALQLLWFRRVRANIAALFALSLVLNVGMWLERFMIVVTALHRDFLPSAWGEFRPTAWDWAHFAGSLGLFAAMFLLFVRWVPVVSMHEMGGLLARRRGDTA